MEDIPPGAPPPDTVMEDVEPGAPPPDTLMEDVQPGSPLTNTVMEDILTYNMNKEIDTLEPTSTDTTEPTSFDTTDPTAIDTTDPTAFVLSLLQSFDTVDPTSFDTIDPVALTLLQSFDTIDATSIDTTGPTTTLDANTTDTTTTIPTQTDLPANTTDTTTTFPTQTDLPIWERIRIEIARAGPLDPAADTTVLAKTPGGIEYYEDLDLPPLDTDKIYDFDFPIDDPIPGVSLYFVSSTSCPETPPKPRSAMSLLDEAQSFETPDFDMDFDDENQQQDVPNDEHPHPSSSDDDDDKDALQNHTRRPRPVPKALTAFLDIEAVDAGEEDDEEEDDEEMRGFLDDDVASPWDVADKALSTALVETGPLNEEWDSLLARARGRAQSSISAKEKHEHLTSSQGTPGSLWRVSVTNGTEQAVAFALMNKCLATESSHGIHSVIGHRSRPGWVYIEAPVQADVRRFIQGVSNIGQYQQILAVPPAETLSCLQGAPPFIPPSNSW
ncbi:hypothetical protein H0H93_006398, partial [Arthromyces matolae]